MFALFWALLDPVLGNNIADVGGAQSHGQVVLGALAQNTATNYAMFWISWFFNCFFMFFWDFVSRKYWISHWQILIFGPKSTRGPCDDLGRSFGIIFSPKFQNPTRLVNHFHILFYFVFQKNMKIQLFQHPLNSRALGTPLGCKSAKFYSG